MNTIELAIDVELYDLSIAELAALGTDAADTALDELLRETARSLPESEQLHLAGAELGILVQTALEDGETLAATVEELNYNRPNLAVYWAAGVAFDPPTHGTVAETTEGIAAALNRVFSLTETPVTAVAAGGDITLTSTRKGA